jgi:cobalt-zinc-cadmium resistance protein CzcA
MERSNTKKGIDFTSTNAILQLLYLQEKKKLLIKSVTVYDEFLRKSTLRLEQGESNILEKTTAENQWSGKNSTFKLQSDYKIAPHNSFKILIKICTILGGI